jgi:hypothetical protein
MNNVEHLLENGLFAVEEALKKKASAYEAFENEMEKNYNQRMLEMVSLTKDELWCIIQYFVFEVNIGL